MNPVNRAFFIAIGAITLFLQTARTQSITSAEYFIDSDPGPCNGSAITISAGGTIDENVNVPANVIAGLSDGYHRIVCRVLDGAGDWSVAFTRTFRKVSPQSLEPTPDIIDGEYFFDLDPGTGSGTPISVSPNTSLD